MPKTTSFCGGFEDKYQLRMLETGMQSMISSSVQGRLIVVRDVEVDVGRGNIGDFRLADII